MTMRNDLILLIGEHIMQLAGLQGEIHLRIDIFKHIAYPCLKGENVLSINYWHTIHRAKGLLVPCIVNEYTILLSSHMPRSVSIPLKNHANV